MATKGKLDLTDLSAALLAKYQELHPEFKFNSRNESKLMEILFNETNISKFKDGIKYMRILEAFQIMEFCTVDSYNRLNKLIEISSPVTDVEKVYQHITKWKQDYNLILDNYDKAILEK